MAIQTVKTGAAVNDGTGDDARTAFTKINQNFSDWPNAASRLVGKAAGNVMEVGAFGVGRYQDLRSLSFENISPFLNSGVTSGLLTKEQLNITTGKNFNGLIMHNWADYSVNATVLAMSSQGMFYRFTQGTAWDTCYKVLSTQNTSIDPNGFIKGASPIVQLFADKIELNDEANLQDITFEKLGVGDYLIKGSLGFAQEGWYIETPKDANGNVLAAVIYEQLENNDISVKTYDYTLNKKGRIVPDLKTPLDIPETRWIDIRLQELPKPDVTTPTDTTHAE